MNKKELRANGELYLYDQELIDEINKGREACYIYNNLNPMSFDKREECIKNLFGKIKGSFLINQPFYCDYGYNIEIGDNFFSNMNLTILDEAKVIFGDNVFIAPNCAFYTSGHPIDYKIRNQGYEYAKPILVGDNVWFGANSIVLPGVKIGNNVVVAAGTVVNKDVPNNVLIAGNPFKIIKSI